MLGPSVPSSRFVMAVVKPDDPDGPLRTEKCASVGTVQDSTAGDSTAQDSTASDRAAGRMTAQERHGNHERQLFNDG